MILRLILFLIWVQNALGGYCNLSSDDTSWFYRRKHNAKQTFGCTTSSCQGIQVHLYHNGNWDLAAERTLSFSDCQTKEDLGSLVCSSLSLSTDCSLYTPWGTRVTSCADIKPQDSIFIVPDNRMFILPIREPTDVQHIILPGKSANSSIPPIRIRSLSDRPRVALLEHLLTEAEATYLVQQFDEEVQFERAVSVEGDGEDEEEGNKLSHLREAERVEVFGETGSALKKRIFDLLGIFPFEESYAESLQVFRLSEGQAWPLSADYLSHGDELDATHDYKSAEKGSNRLLTLLLVLQQADLGGDLFLPKLNPLFASPQESNMAGKMRSHELSVDDLVNQYNLPQEYREENWAREILASCYTSNTSAASADPSADSPYATSLKPQIVPALGAAGVVIYTQQSSGEAEDLSLYSICPVLQGSLYVAKLHIWNAPKHFQPQLLEKKAMTVSATFESRDVYGAKLYWEDQIWEELVIGRPVKVNTYAGHQWNVRLELDEAPVVFYTIQASPLSQRFVLTARDLPIYNY